MSSLTRKRAFALTAALLLSTYASAQRATEEDSLASERLQLQQRGRDVLHPGEPLALVGLPDGAPEFRAETPALAAATLALADVERGALYERRLALVEGEARFDRSLSTRSRDREPAGQTSAPRSKAAPSALDESARAQVWPWVAAALVAAGTAALLKARAWRGARR